MIKLTIDNQEVKKQEYLDVVKEAVVNRINYLKISLEHLQGTKIDLTQKIASFKVVTRDAIRIIEGEKYTEGNYDKPNYEQTIKTYIALGSANKLSSVNVLGIIDLLDHLLKDDGKIIGELLICPANELLSLNRDMISIIQPASEKEQNLVKLGFDYDFLSPVIKKFFNDNNFIVYCPYCNIENVAIIPINKIKNATGHQLDHFFSQKDYPLLSYSFFNLVPSGSNCNGVINKGQIPFTDDFHMNPHSSGFGDNMRFIPVLTGIEMTGIDIKFNCAPGSKEIKQLIGDLNVIDELHKKGNINVFKLRSKYSDEEHVDWAKTILGRIHNAHNGGRSIFKFIKLMKNPNLEAIHLEWYKNQISTPFYSEDFGRRKDSKFNRDIHDYYFESNKSVINKFFQYVSPFLKKY